MRCVQTFRKIEKPRMVLLVLRSKRKAQPKVNRPRLKIPKRTVFKRFLTFGASLNYSIRLLHAGSTKTRRHMLAHRTQKSPRWRKLTICKIQRALNGIET